jgi:hypothetical protein
VAVLHNIGVDRIVSTRGIAPVGQPQPAPAAVVVPLSPPTPQAPALPQDESALRVMIAAAIEARGEAQASLRLSEAAHERAERHIERCRTALAVFAQLDEQITAATVQQLVDGDRPRIDLSDGLREKLTERSRAEADLQAAERAVGVLRRHRADVSVAVGKAVTEVQRLGIAVLAVQAIADAQRLEAMITETRSGLVELLKFDMLSTANRSTVPTQVLDALRHHGRQFDVDLNTTDQADREPWASRLAQLIEDPQAEIG